MSIFAGVVHSSTIGGMNFTISPYALQQSEVMKLKRWRTGHRRQSSERRYWALRPIMVMQPGVIMGPDGVTWVHPEICRGAD